MRFGFVWIDFEKSIQNMIRSGGFHKKDIQTHQKIFIFLRFLFFLDQFAVFTYWFEFENALLKDTCLPSPISC
jgi:hypothetical protein